MKASNVKYQNSEIRKPSWLQNFFILCSGGDREIINEYPTEWNKFAGIGATLFLTACLALLSGGYAIYLVFESAWVSVLFGILWAIVIFNLDRYIVLSLRKEKIPTNTDIQRELNNDKKEELKTERIRLLWNQVLMASPRFIIALIIAITVSKPIELRLFKNRIEKELEKTVKTEVAKFDAEEQIRVNQLNNQLASINNQELNDKSAVFSRDPIYQDAKAQIPRIEAELTRKEQKIASNKRIIDSNKYKETRTKTRKIPNTNETERVYYTVWVLNPTAIRISGENRILEKERQILLSNLSAQKQKQTGVETSLTQQAMAISNIYKPLKASVEQQIQNLKNTYEERKKAWIIVNKRSVDLPSRLEALGRISKFGNSIWWASFVITLLFIALETAPVVVKLLTKRGPYDERLDAIEYQVYIEESRKVDSLNREINEYMKLANEAAKLSGSLKLDAEKDKLDIELRNNKELLNKLADYQKELAEIYADAWFQEEKAKALQQVNGLYQQANKTMQQTKFEDTFWKQKGAADKIEYYFRNGSLTVNELLYFENEQLNKGKWSFNSNKDEIVIDLLNNKVEYVITEIKGATLKLKDKATNDIIEFEKV